MTQTPKKSSGFSLLELMVTIVIIATLITIALPSYQNSVMTSRRAAAQADLLELAGWTERIYTEENKYPSMANLLFTRSPHSGTAHYDLSFSARTDHTFTLEAAPVARSSQVSDRCGTLTMTNTGKYGAIKGTTAVADCWP